MERYVYPQGRAQEAAGFVSSLGDLTSLGRKVTELMKSPVVAKMSATVSRLEARPRLYQQNVEMSHEGLPKAVAKRELMELQQGLRVLRASRGHGLGLHRMGSIHRGKWNSPVSLPR